MRDQYFVLVVVLSLLVGCQSKTENPESTSKKGDPNGVAQNDSTTTSGEPSKPLTPKEAVAASNTASPDEVCRIFLDLLRTENTREAQKLFTRKAMSLTLRHDLPLSFPGAQDATVELGSAKFATSKQELCQVMCTITDTVDGVESESELGWVLKKANDGWRICGMLLPLEEGKPMDFLSFESSADLGRVKEMIAGGPPVDELQVKASFPVSTK